MTRRATDHMTAPLWYRKKPVRIEAIQFLGEQNCAAVCDFLGYSHDEDASHDLIDISTSRGVMTAGVGDWVIRAETGEVDTYKPDDFKVTYEVCDPQPHPVYDFRNEASA